MALFVPDRSGNNPFGGILVGDPATKPRGFKEYLLAGSYGPQGNVVPVNLLAGARTPFTYNVIGGSYLVFADAVTWGGSAQIQMLDDAGNFLNVDAVRSADYLGTAAIVIGEGATLCVLNSGGGTITGLIVELK